MSFPNFALYSTPVNKTAGRVKFGESEAWEPKFKDGNRHTFDAPPKPIGQPQDGAKDYTGIRRGRLVAAYWYETDSRKGPLWVCRCDCGKYELRRPRTWSKKTEQDACKVCEATHRVTFGCEIGDTQSQKAKRIKEGV
jgi:hypothetical protein